MKHISIEGMDGVGKTTICNLLQQQLQWSFVEQPLHLLFDESDNNRTIYKKIRDEINKNPNRNLSAWFYGLGSLYMYDRYKDTNIITDRHLASNYAWGGETCNLDIFSLLLHKIPVPNLTVILRAQQSTIEKRLLNRNRQDSDLSKTEKTNYIYQKMEAFCKDFQLPYIIIDTDELTPEQIVHQIIACLKEREIIEWN
ncbi:dTMP kinase [Ureaplasma ceti]|uniref:Thymidylate kinase-like domain-containing protein n=1 Tax=Ureaplasma ceti TaxID=3119530 RepID=A0ABP9U5T9_9BACT